ncbi:MAG: 3-dehydroquinate synthase [Acidobacteriota bacterium]
MSLRWDLDLRVGERTTQIVVGSGALADAAERLGPWLEGRTVFALSSPAVLRHHASRLAPLEQRAGRWHWLEAPDGEDAKTTEVAGQLWSQMVAAGGKRDSRLVAFGGGSIGDLGGFVAGCFLRGIEFVQLPTTLLAQVDAALGGKTGVDLPEGKNTVGLFHHPAAVVADTEVLATLAANEIRSGLVEVVKMAALLDPELLTRVEAERASLLAGAAETLAPVVAAAAAAKCRVVEQDPRESGLRKVLNFGHTLGHAIETAAGYGTLRHGEAVAYGILFVLRLGERLGVARDGDSNDAVGPRLRRLLGAFGLPPLPFAPADAERLLALTRRDKKATESGVTWVLAAGAGEHVFRGGLDDALVLEVLRDFLSTPRLGCRSTD